MSLPKYPILVVSYIDETRVSLAATLAKSGAALVCCSTFCEAENLALKGLYSGILVDLPSMIKSKGEEKIVAYTLTNFFPTLRVRTMGAMLVPMTMSGGARQDKSLDDFVQKSCASHVPKRLREFRRHPVCLSTLVQYQEAVLRGFTLDLSWGGAFIVDIEAEKYAIGDSLIISFTEFGLQVTASVCRIKVWGPQRYAPGVGLCFSSIDEPLESAIAGVIRTRKEFDRDRLTS